MLANNWNRLGGSNVVAGIPLVVPWNRLEVFSDELLPPG
jgi:hypothetical protein